MDVTSLMVTIIGVFLTAVLTQTGVVIGSAMEFLYLLVCN